MGLGGKIALGCGGLVVLLLVVLGLGAMGSYNGLNSLSQAVDAQWGQVENVYQRRSDLVPNLVATVKGAAAFEKLFARFDRKISFVLAVGVALHAGGLEDGRDVFFEVDLARSRRRHGRKYPVLL